jgi:hypothetical protein
MSPVVEITTLDHVQRCEARLESLIESGASPDKVAAAQDKLISARETAGREAQRRLELDQVRGKVQRKRAEEARLARVKELREAEDRIRKSEHAPRVRIEYGGVRVTIHPEKVADPVARTSARAAIGSTLGTFTGQLDRAIGATRGGPAPLDRERLLALLRDELRAAIRLNVVEVEEV